ncbi:phosphate signaling complex protein PhoU [Phytohabitans sp. ZYX-F-186]|uniref:Phosphate-specific transport system accessory protein PhoU n=1 Tax=Phytohabitans maris TaxID=3071409 RepID=A0ABU0ZAC4_9ACTN|nr:phosphate signaling complex protein PhoU [Phytohabitans sp. ZYX-F-186]MDQ7904005.1 phosphate signaling complex protein PhoU [Phytohabitans sp. ZYX-F-186]
MRTELQAELDLVKQMLVAAGEAVRTAIGGATAALLAADRAAAESAIAGDEKINDLCWRIEDRVRDTMARQAPVATDLRALFSAVYVAADLERMGDLAKHVARTAAHGEPQPAEVAPLFGQMAGVADRMAAKLVRVLSEPDAARATELAQDDNAMDALHRDLLARLFHPSWSYGTQAAIDAALLGRFYERYADHAVNAGRRVAFLVSAERERAA